MGTVTSLYVTPRILQPIVTEAEATFALLAAFLEIVYHELS